MMRILLKNIGKLATPVSGAAPYCVKTYNRPTLSIIDGKIEFIGSDGSLPAGEFDKTCDCKGYLATPGLIDAHTHPVFSATREAEFHLRNSGISYSEIAEKGGGIRSSVKSLRKVSQSELERILIRRLSGFLKLGTTTIEAKSGYGLSLEDELKSLRALKSAASKLRLEIVPTFLGAHEIPDEYRQRRDEYIRIIMQEMIPAVVRENLAEFCDIFVEKGVYTQDEARVILTCAKNAGLKIRLHIDQLSPGKGAELAAELKAISADHLEHISDEGIERMIEAGVIFNLLPGSVFFLGGQKYPPARKIIAQGGIIALSTDFNPGSSMTRSLPLMMTIACTQMKMTAEEALCAVTLNPARSLCREQIIGSIEVGKQADIALWEAPDYDYIPYHYGESLVRMVFKRGELDFNSR